MSRYAWLAYDWMERMSCFAVRVVGLIRLEFAVDVEGQINCVEHTCNAVSDFFVG